MKIAGFKDDPRLLDVFKRFRRGLEPLLALHDALLRDPAPLSPAERELIAAYVSGLNQCCFCFGAHTAIAGAFGIETTVFNRLIEDPASAPIDPRMQPLLAYVRKLTLTPSRMTQGDVDAVFAAGWDAEALYCAVSVCALFNYMNRIVEGMGVVPGEAPLQVPVEVLRGQYQGLIPMLDDME